MASEEDGDGIVIPLTVDDLMICHMCGCLISAKHRPEHATFHAALSELAKFATMAVPILKSFGKKN